MYERHFGFARAPFRLSPDSESPFASQNHHDVLAAMREVFALRSPLLVVSGELGSGKTTMLRHWLEECRARGVVVAHLVNTQLTPDELMQAVAMQFNALLADVAPTDASECLRQFFLRLSGRSVLLAIDESQNLSSEALACLAGLSELALAQGTVFRICLTGQPELRTHLSDPKLAGLRALIQRMCHLGALGQAQTQGYIEHRLARVGWVGVPSFDAGALEEIHRFTEGVPRRINVLVNRLLLSQMLSGSTRIDAPCVVTVARALRAEIAHERADASRRTAHETAPRSRGGRGAVMLVASGRSDHVKVVPLLHAIECRDDLPAPVLVSASGRVPWRLNRGLHEFVGLTCSPIELSGDERPSLNDIAARFERALDEHEPEAVIVLDGNAVSQCCAMICHERGVPIVHVGSDPQSSHERPETGSPRAEIARLANLRFGCQPTLRPAEARAAGTVDLGNPLIDAVRFALQVEMQDSTSFEHDTITAAFEEERRGYGLVALKAWHGDAAMPHSPEMLTVLREVSRDLPLVWPVRWDVASRKGLVRMLEGCQLTCIDELGHAAFVNLLRDATCVLTDCLDVIEEAAALHVPAISLGANHIGQAGDGGWLKDTEAGHSVQRVTRAVWQIVFNGGREIDTPPKWDGHAAPRIAAFLAQWLGRQRPQENPVRLRVNAPPG